MTTCDQSTIVKTKAKARDTQGATASAEEPFSEHDIDYILAQLPTPTSRECVREALIDNYYGIDDTIAYLLAIDLPAPPPVAEAAPPSPQPLERIMSITGIYNVDLVERSFLENNGSIDSTVEALMKLSTEDQDDADEQFEDQPTNDPAPKKPRTVAQRQLRTDKKKAKKQRATEKHRAKIIATEETKPTKPVEDKPAAVADNDPQQPPVPHANMEFIRI